MGSNEKNEKIKYKSWNHSELQNNRYSFQKPVNTENRLGILDQI